MGLLQELRWWYVVLVVLFLMLCIWIFRKFKKKKEIITIYDTKKLKYSKNEFAEKEIFAKELEIYKAYDYFSDRKGIKSIWKTLREFYYVRKRYADVIGINMELESGRFIEFLIPIDRKRFHFSGGTYIIDSEMKYDKANSKFYWLDYHESFALPIRRHIELKPIKEGMTLKSVETKKISYATNPQTLDELIRSEIAQQILRTEDNKDMLIIVLIIIVLLITLYTTYKTWSNGEQIKDLTLIIANGLKR